VEVCASALSDVNKRLRRVQGQIGGIIQMIEDGRQCTDVLTQIASASTELRQCLAHSGDAGQGAPSEQELERLFMALA
jgi:hypothetical protein